MANENETQVMDPRSTLALAIEKGMDPVTLGKLMDLQERWDANLARKAFVTAMAAFKRDVPAVIGKDKKADFGAGRAKYSYATTGALITAITPAMSKNGLHLSWETKQDGDNIIVTCHITHDAGHRESSVLSGKRDESGGKNPIQMIGSAVHYLQRYTLVSVLGLATADMDDPDNGNNRPPIEMPREQPPAKPEGDVVTGPVEEVTEASGVGKDKIVNGKTIKGKPWTRYGIKVGGVVYGTFDKAHADLARDAQTQKKPVALAWLKQGEHMNVATINVADASPDSTGLSEAEKAEIKDGELL